MDLDLLATTLDELGEPGYRAGQVWRWAAEGADSFEEMTDLPLALRSRLSELVPFSSLVVEHEAHATDQTVKVLFRTHDGRPLEAVLTVATRCACPRSRAAR
jgi:23S rRNA (adenine2503-C2)-methyltransferase